METPASVLVAHASIGSGYRLAAEAIARELSDSPSVRAVVIDVLEGCSARGVRRAATGAPGSPGSRLAHAVQTRVPSVSRRWFEALLESTHADVVVCTHPYPAAIAASLASRNRARPRVVFVASGFGVHGFVPRTGVSLYCSSCDANAERLAALGVIPAQIAVTGIPVRAQFTVEYDTAAARSHFGLPPEGRVILAIAGSTDPVPYGTLQETLSVSLPALASLPETTLAIVAGDDAEFARAMVSRSRGFGTTSVRVFEHVEHMAPLIACADLVLTRPSALTCAECMVTGVPVVMLAPKGDSEVANARVLAQIGAGVFVQEPSALSEQVCKVMSSGSRLSRMQAATRRVARPFAAADIATRTLALAGVGVQAGAPWDAS